MSNSNLVVAELPNGLSIDMPADKKVHIVSDCAVFLITTSEHSINYPELCFLPVPDEAIEAYEIPEFLFRGCGG